MSKEFSTTKQVDITIRNKLIKEKRDVNVYHHCNRSSHIVSFNSSLTRGIKPMEENDYLHISVVSGPGHLKNYCILDLPSFVDFKFSLSGEEITIIHSRERMLLRVPPGPPIWQLIMTIPTRLSNMSSVVGYYVTIGDADEWPDYSFGEEWKDEPKLIEEKKLFRDGLQDFLKNFFRRFFTKIGPLEAKNK